ncbi:Superfamily I DNA and RNA helicases and helicase subunits-like protein [Minicystis rosea]|nr:Superfamily I DNA and RNA helicases and helicase subunits-like protein [Minicystis rosea]
MLVQRIALLAERLGIPLPRIAGQTRLGLSGTIRVTRPVPLTFTPRADEQIAEVDPGLSRAALIDALNASHVWTWLEVRGGEGRWRWPEMGDEPDVLVRCSKGDLPPQDFSLLLSTARWSLRSVPAREGSGLLVLGVLKPRRAPCARLLVANFANRSDSTFDTKGMCTLVASQTRVRVRVDQREVEREAADDRDFITGVRRYLEALRNHTVSSTPRAKYVLIERSPVRLRTRDADAWPRTFTRPGTLLQVPTASEQLRTFPVLDVSDDSDVITLDGDDEREELIEQGELKVRPGDDSLRRMREALDTIAMGTDEAHGRLLEALTRPESLQDIPSPSAGGADDQTSRQLEATALAANTPDIALIHGPPGTGKTTVICGIVEELVKRGQRVLLVAPTHVALDNVLERVGDRPGVTAIRLGSADNVEEQAHRFLLRNRSKDLTRHLAKDLRAATSDAPFDDPVAAVQREWAGRIASNDEVGTLLLLNANLVCATPIGIAMAREFREVEVVFDVMILDEASKATITDFLVPAARARKWILVGDHRQLAPYVDLGELQAVVSERVKRAGVGEPDEGWVRELSTRIRQHFDNRMHPDPERVALAWGDFVDELTRPFEIDDATFDELVALGADPEKWRETYRTALRSNGEGQGGHRATVFRLGAELLELQALALPSVFEHLTRLPPSRAVRLNFQHRMAPALASFSSELVYGGDYPSARETAKLGLDIPSLEAPAIWIDTAYAPAARRYEYPRDRDWSGGDYINPLEVDVAVELVEASAAWAVQSWRGDLRERGRGPNAPFEIGVISFYLKQALQLRDAIFRKLASGTDPWRRRWKSPAANGAPIDIHVSIVDRFQGREKDLIILCTTRSNPKGRRGHVDNLNRLNVAVTRARHKRIVIGDSTTLAGQEGGRRRQPGDLLARLYETSEHKKKWGRALGGRS